MSRPNLLFYLALCFALVFMAQSEAHAHRVNIFAWAESGQIHTESTFSGGKQARHAQVNVLDASGKTLVSGKTDKHGAFSFPIPPEALKSRTDLRLELVAGQGHRGEWVITAQEYMSAAPKPPGKEHENGPTAMDIGVGLLIIFTLFGAAALVRKKTHKAASC